MTTNDGAESFKQVRLLYDMTKKEPHTFKFMSVDGKIFHLRYRSTFDALLDGSFLGFLTLCLILFIVNNTITSALYGGVEKTLSSPLFLLATVTLFGMTLLGILCLMFIFCMIFHRLAKWGLMTTIYTPLFYVIPIVVYAIGIWFLQGFEVTARTFEMTAMFLIICACYDILYGNFVAPYHSKYIDRNDIVALSNRPQLPLEQSTDAVNEPISPNASSDQQMPDVKRRALADESATENTTDPSTLESSEHRPRINIRKQSFFRDEIRWIQSEDHYLQVHLTSKSVLILGRLSDAVTQLSEEQGVQISRSIWVAHDAIQSIDALNSRTMFLTLTTGEKLKVTKMGRELLEKTSAVRANG